MQSVGQLGLIGPSQLRDLRGLSRLSTIHGSLVVAYLPRLTSFAGLPQPPADLPAADLSGECRERGVGALHLAGGPGFQYVQVQGRQPEA